MINDTSTSTPLERDQPPTLERKDQLKMQQLQQWAMYCGATERISYYQQCISDKQAEFAVSMSLFCESQEKQQALQKTCTDIRDQLDALQKKLGQTEAEKELQVLNAKHMLACMEQMKADVQRSQYQLQLAQSDFIKFSLSLPANIGAFQAKEDANANANANAKLSQPVAAHAAIEAENREKTTTNALQALLQKVSGTLPVPRDLTSGATQQNEHDPSKGSELLRNSSTTDSYTFNPDPHNNPDSRNIVRIKREREDDKGNDRSSETSRQPYKRGYTFCPYFNRRGGCYRNAGICHRSHRCSTCQSLSHGATECDIEIYER